jgi:hypothetical protein
MWCGKNCSKRDRRQPIKVPDTIPSPPQRGTSKSESEVALSSLAVCAGHVVAAVEVVMVVAMQT